MREIHIFWPELHQIGEKEPILPGERKACSVLGCCFPSNRVDAEWTMEGGVPVMTRASSTPPSPRHPHPLSGAHGVAKAGSPCWTPFLCLRQTLKEEW